MYCSYPLDSSIYERLANAEQIDTRAQKLIDLGEYLIDPLRWEISTCPESGVAGAQPRLRTVYNLRIQVHCSSSRGNAYRGCKTSPAVLNGLAAVEIARAASLTRSWLS